MDTFEDENFNAIDFINATYAASKTESKEEFVSALVSQLQIHVQDVNGVLEDTSQQMIGNMPKIMRDMDNLRREALTLQKTMHEMKAEIAQVQRETGSCMANLERLDTLKTKLQVAKQGLQESDGWGRLTSELEDLLERNDVAGGCEKLSILQRSLAAQVGLPGQSEREMHVEEAKNKLEALASPQVVKCFSVGDATEALKYVEMFGKMERLPQLKQYYRTVQKTRLQSQWQEIVDLAENSRDLRFLREFYHHLLEHFQKQVKWCSLVFGSVDGLVETVCVISDTLATLQPPRETAITNLLKRQNDKLEAIAEFSAANQFFGMTLQKHIHSSGSSIQKDQLVALSKGIYDFFQVFIIQYGALEQNWLSGHLVSLGLANQVVALETVRSLGNCNAKVLQAASNALQRCESITQNCAIGPLVTVLNSFFREYLDKYKKAQKQLDATRNVPNVNFLQICTTLLQYLGDFILQLTTFEEEVIAKILATYEQVCRQEMSSFQYKVLRKQDVSEIKKFKNLVNEKQTRGDFGSNPWSIFSGLIEVVKPICAEIHDTTLASVFAPIETHLRTIEPTDSSSSSTDLPDYSFAPQEYITQVGQYLMTLPQHLEPFLLSPSDALRRSLEIADEKYSQSATSGDVLLALIAEECCALYMENIYKIGSLSNTAAKQLATDIEYLGSVLEELGLKLGSQIQQVAVLLRAAPENYLNLSAGCDPKLVTAVRQMRNIISTE
ncbi:conserved oligomeric Golgi complex subunit 7 [Phlebotomus argentipes]|uniref:conserved oligomeric Golgi complex subunit 7 n=1 Tax=Phlebotomus argentipes TaxID=94469 RepID=UPI002892E57F|nr:conserved oligomeric Golgi complex subunit 7 [Phlebotomus argentipes]